MNGSLVVEPGARDQDVKHFEDCWPTIGEEREKARSEKLIGNTSTK